MNFPKGSSHLNRLMIEIKGLGNKSKTSKCTERKSPLKWDISFYDYLAYVASLVTVWLDA